MRFKVLPKVSKERSVRDFGETAKFSPSYVNGKFYYLHTLCHGEEKIYIKIKRNLIKSKVSGI